MQEVVNFANTARKAVAGYKTYIVGACTLVLGLVNGDWNAVAIGFGMITTRAGIAKSKG